MAYVYLYSRFNRMYTVGQYTAEGDWIPESDHDTESSAVAQTLHLNHAPADVAELREANAQLTQVVETQREIIAQRDETIRRLQNDPVRRAAAEVMALVGPLRGAHVEYPGGI